MKKIILGDAVTLTIPLRHAGQPFIPAGLYALIFTAKLDPEDTDDEAVIQKTSSLGITESGDDALVELVTWDTGGREADPGADPPVTAIPALAADITLYCDIIAQEIADPENVFQVARFDLQTVRRITRLPETSVDIYTTTDPAILLRGESAYEVAVANGFVGTEAAWLASLEASVTNANVNAAISTNTSATRTALGLGNSATLNVGTTTGTVAAGDDSRLSNSREWTAETVEQAEAEAGAATTRRAWTALRVRQAIAAWWATVSSTKADASHAHAWSDLTSGVPTTFAPSAHTHPASEVSDSTTVGRALMTAVNASAARTTLELGNAALTTTSTGGNGAADDGKVPVYVGNGGLQYTGPLIAHDETTEFYAVSPTQGLTAIRTHATPNADGVKAITGNAFGIPDNLVTSSTKTTPIDADSVLMTDSAAAGTPAKRLTFANLWSWIVTKLGALASISAGGAWSFTSTTRPTSSGTGTPAATSLITLADGDARYLHPAGPTAIVDDETGLVALGVGDEGKLYRCKNATSTSIIIPTHATVPYENKTVLYARRCTGAGPVTISGAGVSINDNTSADVTEGGLMAVMKVDDNIWDFI
mgnify:CR=1 FL=1|jgi:hypothetical protein